MAYSKGPVTRARSSALALVRAALVDPITGAKGVIPTCKSMRKVVDSLARRMKPRAVSSNETKRERAYSLHLLSSNMS